MSRPSRLTALHYEHKATHFSWNKLPYKLDAVLFHVFPNFVGHVLVKSSEEDGADHHSDVQADTSKKSCTLQSHVGRSNHQGLARTVGQGEEIVTEKATGNEENGHMGTMTQVLSNS